MRLDDSYLEFPTSFAANTMGSPRKVEEESKSPVGIEGFIKAWKGEIEDGVSEYSFDQISPGVVSSLQPQIFQAPGTLR